MVFEGARLHSCSTGGKFLYLSIPKIGLLKVRHHRYLPDGAILKSVQVIKKTDGWYINLRLQDDTVPDFKPDIIPSWDNSLGMDAVLHENDYSATSEGIKLPSLKSFRKANINIKRVGLGLFPTIKRRKGNLVVNNSTTNSTLKEVLLVHQFWTTQKPTLYSIESV
jgi:putative transposase